MKLFASAILIAALSSNLTLAQSSVTAGRKAKPEISAEPADVESIKRKAAEYVSTCMADWDSTTHMTKDEWMRTCKRVADEREKFLLDSIRSAESEKDRGPKTP